MGRYPGWPTGRYQATCEDGHCALRGGQGRSKLEGQIFTLLDLALGPGVSNAPVYTKRGKVDVDMLFPFPGGGIVVEYDGAYFHRDRVRRDQTKSLAITRGSSVGRALVVRIREQPLRKLYASDVSVPPRSDAQQCARLALLHILHRLPQVFDPHELPPDVEARIHGFLQAGRQLDRDMVVCPRCRSLESALLDDFWHRFRRGTLTDFAYRSVWRPARRSLSRTGQAA